MIVDKEVIVLISLICWCNGNSVLNLQLKGHSYVSLNRFWTGTGLSPFAPLPFNRSDVMQQLLANQMQLNMEFVAALPDSGIKHIRIHWLLSLVTFKGFDGHKIPIYDFDALDTFLDHLMQIHLFPVIEFMGNIFPPNDLYDTHFMWKDFVYQLVWHYLSRYGQKILMNFRFELWNEPDLYTYNIQNFTLSTYLEYVHGVRSGLDAASRRMRPEMRIPLRGPAGLFKSLDKHPLCWGLLNQCNANISRCPIDVTTFHRKGINSSTEILTETIELLNKFHDIYPNLNEMPFANTEADPTSGWSKNVTAYADVHYAHMLISTVFEHWTAYLNGALKRFESISHDNSFLSYHPFEFEQRTLLARFAMNQTQPKSVQFIEKPVYAALGMLSALAMTATDIETKENVTYVLTLGEKYAAVLLLSCKPTHVDSIEIEIHHNGGGGDFGYLAEYLDQTRTNPFAVWIKHNRPAYPNQTVLTEMLHAQGPHIVENPKVLGASQSTIKLRIKFHHPWVILVRICMLTIPPPLKVNTVRIHSIDQNTVLIAWTDNAYPNYERCIRTYEIFYAPLTNQTHENVHEMQWQLITANKHIPFLSYCHRATASNQQVQGYYKIRAVDIFGRFSEFSKIYKYQQ